MELHIHFFMPAPYFLFISASPPMAVCFTAIAVRSRPAMAKAGHSLLFSKVVPMPSNRYAPPTRGGGPIGIRTLTRPVMSRMLYQLSCRSIYALPEFRRCPVGSCFLRAAAYIGGHMPRGHPGYDPAGNPKPCPCRAVAHIALPELHRCQKEPLLTGCGLYMPRERAIIRPLEAHTGFEPARSAWKAETLPLHQCAMLVRPGFPGDGLSRANRLS